MGAVCDVWGWILAAGYWLLDAGNQYPVTSIQPISLISVLTPGEYILRLFPLLCGVLSLFLFYKLILQILFITNFTKELDFNSGGELDENKDEPDLYIDKRLIFIIHFVAQYY